MTGWYWKHCCPCLIPCLKNCPRQKSQTGATLKPILCSCNTPASLTSSSDFLQGECQLGCEASIGVQRSAEKNNLVHCHFLYLSLGKCLTPSWRFYINWIARTHWEYARMSQLACGLKSYFIWVSCNQPRFMLSQLGIQGLALLPLLTEMRAQSSVGWSDKCTNGSLWPQM